MENKFEKIAPPEGDPILAGTIGLVVPDRPIIPFIQGDGIGPDIWKAAEQVLTAAVKASYRGQKEIRWFEVHAGDSATRLYGKDRPLPDDTLNAIRRFRVGIKGPLSTPIAGGLRSLNVALRQSLNLFASVRPVRYFPGAYSPLKHPERVNLIIFRENTEDVYTGLEWPAGSPEATEVIDLVNRLMGGKAPVDRASGVGIKPISRHASRRLVMAAVEHAVKNDLPSVTLMHKGNIMKFTEGAFLQWGREAALEEYPDRIILESEVNKEHAGVAPEGKIVLKERIADHMFQEIILRPQDHSVIATTNLNGDYLSDAAAALVGGLGLAPGANIGDRIALFEATHGTAPKYAGKDHANPSSLILSGAEMFRYMGWNEAADLVLDGIKAALAKGHVTADIARWLLDVKPLPCSAFAQAVVEEMSGLIRSRC